MIDFDKSTVFQHLASGGLWLSGDRPVSVHSWNVPDGVGSTSTQTILFNGNTTYWRWREWDQTLGTNQRLGLGMNPGGDPMSPTGNNIAWGDRVAGAWYDNGSTSRAAKDGTWGTAVTSGAPGTPIAAAIGGIGAPYNTHRFNGGIGPITIWEGHQITTGEALSLAAGANAKTIARANLAHRYPMRGAGPVGTRTRDTIGGKHMTVLTGTPTIGSRPPVERNGWAQG